MTEIKKINEFASRYRVLYSDGKTTEKELEDGFAAMCFNLGFKMDAGASFVEKYSPEAFVNSNELNKIIETINDPYFLGNAIFSFWRRTTHWTCESLLEENNRKWMITAFTRLIEITSK